MVAAVLLVLSRVPAEIGRRLAMRRMSRAVRIDTRGEVLLLRSFADDNVKIRVRQLQRTGLDRLGLRRWERFEQSLAHSLYEVGPVEAVGEPGRRLPPLGATRTYYADDDWQREVAERIASAQLVVLSVGRTPAVAWEVRTIREQGALARAIFVIAPVGAEDRRARLHVLAELLEMDPRLLDHEQPGIEVLAVVVPDGTRPTLITSGVRDDASYDWAMRRAAGVLCDDIHAAEPTLAEPRSTPALPSPLIFEPGATRRRPLMVRAMLVMWSLLAVVKIFVWAFGGNEPPIDKVHEIVDLQTTPRFLIPIDGARSVIAVQNLDRGVRVSEIDAVTAQARTLAKLDASPTHGAAAGRWIVLVSPTANTVSGIDRQSSRSWTVSIAGAPHGAAVGVDTALLALSGADTLVEVRLRDGAVLRRVRLHGAPYAVSATPGGWLVSLAAGNRVVRLGKDLTPSAAPFAIQSPRQVFTSDGGSWALSATLGVLRHLEAADETDDRLQDREFLPHVAVSRTYVALASRGEKWIKVADARTGRLIKTFRSPFNVQSIAVTDDGRVVVAFEVYRDLGVYRLR
jgi:hypothetical protein